MSGHGRTDQNLSPIRIIVRMPEPDCFLHYRKSAGTWNFTSEKSDAYILAAAATRGFTMVLRPTVAAMRDFTMVLFTELVSIRNTFVGGTFAPPSALLHCGSKKMRQLWRTITRAQFSRF